MIFFKNEEIVLSNSGDIPEEMSRNVSFAIFGNCEKLRAIS